NTKAGAVTTTAATTTAVVGAADDAAKTTPVATPPKSNTKIWKAYTDSLVTVLKTEVLPNKKVKKETYFLTVDYEMGTDGQLSINSVVSDPENEFLANQLKERMIQSPPQLAPVLDSNNQPRKVKKRQNFSITKE